MEGISLLPSTAMPEHNEPGYAQLVDGDNDVPGARIAFLEPPAVVTLNSTGQHSLEWSERLSANGVTIEPGEHTWFLP